MLRDELLELMEKNHEVDMVVVTNGNTDHVTLTGTVDGRIGIIHQNWPLFDDSTNTTSLYKDEILDLIEFLIKLGARVEKRG